MGEFAGVDVTLLNCGAFWRTQGALEFRLGFHPDFVFLVGHIAVVGEEVTVLFGADKKQRQQIIETLAVVIIFTKPLADFVRFLRIQVALFGVHFGEPSGECDHEPLTGRFLKRHHAPGHIVFLLFRIGGDFEPLDVGAVEQLDRLQAVVLALAGAQDIGQHDLVRPYRLPRFAHHALEIPQNGLLFLFPNVTHQVTGRINLDHSIQKQTVDCWIGAHLLGIPDPPLPHLRVTQVVGLANIANELGFSLPTNEESPGHFIDLRVGLVGAVVHKDIAIV